MPTRPARHVPAGHRPNQGRRDFDSRRPPAHERGYDAAWRKVRAAFLRDNPLCQDCLHGIGRAIGACTPAAQVHHMCKVEDRPDLRLDESNLRALCAAHHNARTARGE